MTRAKIFLAAVLFFCLASSAQAARIVPGTVPQTTPLQPIPESEIVPNLKNNIQAGEFESVTTPPGEQESPNLDEINQNAKTPSAAMEERSPVYTWLGVLFLAAGLGYLIYQIRAKK